MITKEYLESYAEIPATIERINKKIDYYNNHPVSMTYGSVKGSLPEFPYTECHFPVTAGDERDTSERDLKIRQLMVSLCENKKAYEEMRIEVDLFIEHIPDLKLREIFNMKYIDGLTDERIARKFGLERSTISKRITAYLEK